MRPGSLLWSGQVIRGGDTSRYQFSGDNRVNLTFELDMVNILCVHVLERTLNSICPQTPNITNYSCVFWDGRYVVLYSTQTLIVLTACSAWSSEGVETVRNVTDDNGKMMVECSSSHLTAFAVLVDVSGSIQVS